MEKLSDEDLLDDATLDALQARAKSHKSTDARWMVRLIAEVRELRAFKASVRIVPPKAPRRGREMSLARKVSVVRRLLAGDSFYSQGSPRLARWEYNALCEELSWIQCESVHGADRSGGDVYTAMPGLREQAVAAGLIDPLPAPPKEG